MFPLLLVAPSGDIALYVDSDGESPLTTPREILPALIPAFLDGGGLYDAWSIHSEADVDTLVAAWRHGMTSCHLWDVKATDMFVKFADGECCQVLPVVPDGALRRSDDLPYPTRCQAVAVSVTRDDVKSGRLSVRDLASRIL